MRLPMPKGIEWDKMCGEGSRKKRRANHVDFDKDEDAVTVAEQVIQEQLREQNRNVAHGGRYCFQISKTARSMTARVESKRAMKQSRGAMAAKKTKRIKAVATGHAPPPKNARQAMEGENGVEWVKSMNDEFDGLVELGVLDLGYTKAELLKEGIDLDATPAVPCGTYFEHKFGENGEITRHKSRIAVQGHPGNMQKGVHYNETFSATPRENTSKMICALVVLLNLTRFAFDITKAYCWADLPPGELIALKYPDGFKMYDSKTGEELFMILRKNLYGHPGAGRTFSKARDKEIMKKFNTKDWTCHRCRMDPCLFVITKEYEVDGVTTKDRLWMLAHVDDCDIAAESKRIGLDALDVCREIWKITEVSPDFMLGIRRRVQLDKEGNVESCECDMVAYCEGMYEAFREHMPQKLVNEPIPPKLMLSKLDPVEAKESEMVLKAGYQVAVGMILWAVRHCHGIGKAGVSQLCGVMAAPSWKAFGAAMQMIAYIYQNRTEGIKFSKEGNHDLIGMVDASNKPDPADGKCQYGFVITWMGGPIAEVSKKLRHVGLSSEHNEYMGMCFAHQQLVWVRQLLEEMGIDSAIKRPTVMFGDNKAANILSMEDVVTHGNQYMFLPYHFNKEIQEMGFSIVEYIKSAENISDLMTKAVDAATLKRLRGALSGYDLRLIQKIMKDVEDILEAKGY